MDKFNRNYLLRIQKTDLSFLEIRPPFTVEFEVHRNSFSSANVCSIRVYNLNPDNRSQIRFNQYESDIYRSIEFSAGYGDHLSLAYKGNIYQAWSVREGNNFVSQIESFDGGFAYTNAVVDSPPFPAGTKTRDVITQLASDLPGVTLGAIGQFPEELPRDTSYDGNTVKTLTEITKDSFFIDNGKANALGDREAFAGTVPIINSASGLLGTPTKEQTIINLDMLFEPGLIIGQLVQLESETAEYYNGLYKIVSLKHRGIVSEAVSGQAITSVGLLSGEFATVEPRS